MWSHRSGFTMPFLSLWIWWKRFFGLSMGLPFWIVHWVYRERGPKLFERIVEGWGVGIRVGSGRNWVRELRKDAWYIAVDKGLKGGSLEKRAGTGDTGGGRNGPPAPHPPPPPLRLWGFPCPWFWWDLRLALFFPRRMVCDCFSLSLKVQPSRATIVQNL